MYSKVVSERNKLQKKIELIQSRKGLIYGGEILIQNNFFKIIRHQFNLSF